MRICRALPLATITWLLCQAAVSESTAAPQPSAWASPALGYKVEIRNPLLGEEVVRQGGRLIADYGSFQLYGLAQLPPQLAANPEVTLRQEYNRILLHAATLDTSPPTTAPTRKAVGSFTGKRLHLVHFAGPVQPAWREEVLATGVQVVSYLPHNAYLLYGDAAALARVQALAANAPHIQWEGSYLDEYKIHPAAQPFDQKGRPRQLPFDQFAIQLIADPAANPATLQLLDQLKLEPFRRQDAVLDYVNVVARLAPADLKRVAAQPDVVSIQLYPERRKLCERQDQIVAGNISGNSLKGPGYLSWLSSKGFTPAQFAASGFVVDVTDSGIDNGTTSPNHFGLRVAGTMADPSRVVYSRLEGTPNPGSTLIGCDGHGTINAHIIGGYDALSGFPFADSSGYHYGLGVCPFVNLGSSVIFDSELFTYPNYTDLLSRAYQSGARISNNSWGGTNDAYDIDAQTYDALVRDAQPAGSAYPAAGNQEMVIVFAAGNDGPSSHTITSAGTAKNVICVGAAESVQRFGGTDGSGVTDAEADNPNEIISFSSRGPCADGRHKPDLMAPGSHVSGGVPQAASPSATGTAEACYSGSGVSGGAGGNAYFPSGQQFYTASSGTSHATPCVSGGCALLRQYFLNEFTNAPSPAMTKAYLMNATRYLTGSSANDTLWSDAQGMGEMNLGMAFDGTKRLLRDQRPEDLFTASGQTRTFTGTITDTNVPFRVTLAWTDAPGSTTGAAYNNDLDLTVLVNGQLYHGNVFKGAYSTTGGAADTVNNVESVFLPAGTAGGFVVTVTAANINSDGVPNNASPLDQDFALVVYNAQTTTAPVIQGGGYALVGETCSPTNGAIDPGETVTVEFTLRNLGTAATTNLVATLQPSGGVLAPSDPQTYGHLATGGGAATGAFSFTAAGSCGGSLTAQLRLQDGAVDLGTVSFNLPLGQANLRTNLAQSFDSVPGPSLPTGWTSTITGTSLVWTVSRAAADTPPNSAFATDVTTPGISDLLSPALAITSPSAQLTFRHNYDTEADTLSGTGYDGGVLEMKLGAGSFIDILAAGGSFANGSYNQILDPSGDNPLAGRSAWSGASGGFVTTTVNLPAAAAGQTVQFRWRLATDTENFYGGSGWYIDSIWLTDHSYLCCSGAPAAPQINQVTASATNLAVSLMTVPGLTYTLQYKNTLLDTQWLPASAPVPGTGGVITLTDTNALLPSRFYRVLGR